MSRPLDADLTACAARVLGWAEVPVVLERTVLRERPGRCVERLTLRAPGHARPSRLVVKWRHDRPDDREATLYAGLRPAVLRLIAAPGFVGAARLGATHLLWLRWVPGAPLDFHRPGDVEAAFARLGRIHARTAAWLRRDPARIADPRAWAELRPSTPAADGEPDVLDPGDLHPDNTLRMPNGRLRLLDFENLAIRPRLHAVSAALRDAGLPHGPLRTAALTGYWQAAGWTGDAEAFAARL